MNSPDCSTMPRQTPLLLPSPEVMKHHFPVLGVTLPPNAPDRQDLAGWSKCQRIDPVQSGSNRRLLPRGSRTGGAYLIRTAGKGCCCQQNEKKFRSAKDFLDSRMDHYLG